MRNYQNGKIYAVRSRSRPDLVYVGSTVSPLSERMGRHRGPNNDCTSKQIVDIGDAYIELIELYPCNSKEELNRREGHFQRSMDCVNKVIAGRTIAEYREDNKEAFAARQKQYQEDNKEAISAYKKQYYEDNKEADAARVKQYREDNKESIAARQKQYREDNQEYISALYKQYQRDNKEKLNRYQRQYKQSKKDIRTCICGSQYDYGYSRKKHYTTQKHQAHVALIYAKLNGTSSTMKKF